MKVNKNIWVGKNKPYNQNSLYFPNGIDSGITAGGGSGESGGGRTIYVRYEKGNQSVLAAMFSSYLRVLATDENRTAVVIGPGQFTEYMKMVFPNGEFTNDAFSLELDRKIGYGMGQESVFASVEEQLVQSGVDINSLTLITEEEFYDLNTELTQ